jgi:hypothetical protein
MISTGYSISTRKLKLFASCLALKRSALQDFVISGGDIKRQLQNSQVSAQEGREASSS